jgi:hypothetical protein
MQNFGNYANSNRLSFANPPHRAPGPPRLQTMPEHPLPVLPPHPRYNLQSCRRRTDHLEKTLNSNEYKITIRPEGDQYLGMNIAFNTARTAVTISMPGCVQKMLTRFRPQYLDTTHRPARMPGRYIALVYDQKSPQLTSTIPRAYRLSQSPNFRLSSAHFCITRTPWTHRYSLSQMNSHRNNRNPQPPSCTPPTGPLATALEVPTWRPHFMHAA